MHDEKPLAGLTQIRQDKGWSISELSRRSGVSYATIWRMEKTGKGTSWADVVSVVHALGGLVRIELRPSPPHGRRIAVKLRQDRDHLKDCAFHLGGECNCGAIRPMTMREQEEHERGGK